MIAWITDGSLVRWADTHRPGVWVHGLQARLFFEAYEGLVDSAVEVGTLSVPMDESKTRYGLDGEAEWVVDFGAPIADLDISADTECTLKGMIEGKWVAPMVQAGEIDWATPSLGNNVMTASGFRTKLGEIGKGRSSGVPRLEIAVRFSAMNGEERTHTTLTGDVGRHEVDDLEEVPVLGLVRGVAEWSRENRGEGEITAVNLGAAGKKAAYVNEPTRIRQSAKEACGTTLARTLLHLNPLEAMDLVNNARVHLFQTLIDDREYADPSQSVELTLTRGDETMGEAKLLFDQQA